MNYLGHKSTTGIEAITLDLDDTLWPVAPTIAGAEQDLFDWLCAHAPKTADLTRQKWS
jgi:putative hydrolase of the HAD superfamily